MDLFITPSETFEKLSSETALSEDPNAWPQEILQELYKQTPYIADFSPHVVMDQVDGEKGYGFGYVEVMNQTEIQAGQDPSGLAAAGVRQVRIPVVIKNNKLQPLDIMITDDSKVLPLTEVRLRASIFRPQAFDVTSRTPGDQSMIGQLYPPYRQHHGFGGSGIAMDAGMGKQASSLERFLAGGTEKKASALDEYAASSVKHGRLGKKSETKEAEVGSIDAFLSKHASASGSLLQAILPTVNQTDHQKFVNFVSDQQNQALLFKNAAAVVPSIKRLLDTDPIGSEKIASVLPNFIAPSVVQVVRSNGCYKVKTASHLCWSPTEELVDRGVVVKRFGEKVALAADLSGAATIAEGADTAVEDEDAEGAGLISESGVYRVHDDSGNELIGTVIVGLIDTNGAKLPLALFTNGSQAAIQTDVVGTPVLESPPVLPTGDAPSGSGFFFTSDNSGLQATIPFTIKGSFSGVDQTEPVTFQAETFDGKPCQISVQPHIQAPIGVDGKLLIPAHWQWSPIGEAATVSLRSLEMPQQEQQDPQETSNTQPVDELGVNPKEASIYVRSSGAGTFSFQGFPVSDVPYNQREFVGIDDAMFLMAGLGVDQGYGATKLAYATTGSEPIEIRVGRSITTSEKRKEAALKQAATYLAQVPTLKRVMWKEASALSDPAAVDTVLSLGFINPENIMTFVGYLPVIEDSQSKICDLLLAARLGQSEVPQGALEKSIRATEEVLEGLKSLAFQSN